MSLENAPIERALIEFEKSVSVRRAVNPEKVFAAIEVMTLLARISCVSCVSVGNDVDVSDVIAFV